MASYKEIVTKAVLGKGRKTFYTEYEIKPEIEGLSIIHFKAEEKATRLY